MLTSADKDRINDFLHNGNKLEAIKYLRERFSLSLEDASKLITSLSEEDSNPVIQSKVDQSVSINRSIHQLVKEQIQEGNYLKAINLIRQNNQLSLKDAKKYVDNFINETGIQIPSSSFRFNSASFAFLIFLVVGMILLLISLSLGIRDYSFNHQHVRITGRVIRLLYADTDQQSGAVPVIEYTWRGKIYSITGETYSNPPAVKLGEYVDVLISKRDPDHVTIDILSERYFLIIIFGFLGILFSAIGFLGRYGWPRWS